MTYKRFRQKARDKCPKCGKAYLRRMASFQGPDIGMCIECDYKETWGSQ